MPGRRLDLEERGTALGGVGVVRHAPLCGIAKAAAATALRHLVARGRDVEVDARRDRKAEGAPDGRKVERRDVEDVLRGRRWVDIASK